jgi:hypothetical protein
MGRPSRDLRCEGSGQPACETFAVWPERRGWLLGRCGFCGRIVWTDSGRYECVDHDVAADRSDGAPAAARTRQQEA